VTETRLRVPSGDAVQRIYAARDRSGADVVVAEVLNETKVPFAVTFVLRAVDGRAPGVIDVTDRAVVVDGEVVAALPGVPGRIAFAEGDPATDDLRAIVESGNAGLPGGRGLTGKGTQVALLYPLAHTASVRIAAPMAAVPDQIDVRGLPDAKQVVSGWQTQARQGARVVLPERRLQEAVDARVRRALLLGVADPQAPAMLDLFGFAAEADTLLRRSLDADVVDPSPGRALLALGRHAAFTKDAAFARDASEHVAALIAALGTSTSAEDLRRGATAGPLAAELLQLGGHKRGAADAARAGRAMAERAASLDGATEPVAVDLEERLRATVRGASGTWRWPVDDADIAVGLLEDVRRLLIDEGPALLALSPVVPSTWLGQGWEVHDLPTVHGAISFAVRWHGDRPALLWDHVGRADAPVRLSSPGLDPGWSTDEPRGEALLSPVALPAPPDRKGLTIPVSIEPMPKR
jgi:hypothetical protein